MKRSLIITAAMLLTIPALACGPESQRDSEDFTTEERPDVSSPSETAPYDQQSANESQPSMESQPTGQPESATTGQPAGQQDIASYEQRLDQVREDMREIEQEGQAVSGDVEQRIQEVEQALNEARQQPGAESARLDEVDQKLEEIEQELASLQ